MNNLGKYAEKGAPGGPGRPKGFKNRALELINEVYKDREDEARTYIKGLEIEEFLDRFVLPFLPKNIEIGGPDGEPLGLFMTEAQIDKRIRELEAEK